MEDTAAKVPGPATLEEERCPECDAVGEWEIDRRHRFSPFGAVILAVLSFWSAIFGWLLGFGFGPTVVFALGALVVGVATRRAEICTACGFVRPHRR